MYHKILPKVTCKLVNNVLKVDMASIKAIKRISNKKHFNMLKLLRLAVYSQREGEVRPLWCFLWWFDFFGCGYIESRTISLILLSSFHAPFFFSGSSSNRFKSPLQ